MFLFLPLAALVVVVCRGGDAAAGDCVGGGAVCREGGGEAEAERGSALLQGGFRRSSRHADLALKSKVAPSDPAAPSPAPPASATSALDFCDRTQLLAMHGALGVEAHANSSRGDVEEAILNDVENELTENSVDEMAKDIFSFYLCVRWVPDEVFWSVAKQEMTSEILQTVVDTAEATNQAIGELYQNFKFTPLLCSKNLGVYDEKDPDSKTFYRRFEERVDELTTFFNFSLGRPVWEALKHADESFCRTGSMNSAECDAELALNEWVNQVSGWFGDWAQTDFDTKQDKWALLQDIFANFKYRNSSEEALWNNDFAAWKELFPYHSFIGNPQGVDARISPMPDQRFMICFGQRVASEMHRRPGGTNIITDQNSVGCHGFWTPEHAGAMLSRMAQLWRPPTCQLAEKTYVMKKQILQMFQKMNEDLFDALPSILQDEQLFEEDLLSRALAGPAPYSVESAELGGETIFNGTRVARMGDFDYDKPGCSCWLLCSSCRVSIAHGSAGTLLVADGTIRVRWDVDHEGHEWDVAAGDVHVVPHEYGLSSEGILDAIGSTLAHVGQSILDLFGSAISSQQSNLAEMLSGSLTKWVVCGVAENVSYGELDSWLGTEDEAFQEHVKEAYAKWTGYKAEVPGEQCTQDPALDSTIFAGCSICEFSELHVDWPEKYFNSTGVQEDFMCPLVPPMSPAEQLEVWKAKKGMCLLHMTDRLKRQFGWHYQGHYPARRQNDKQSNLPMPEYQLTKLLEISTAAGPQQISFGRACSVEEVNANPRFCTPPQLREPWPSVEDMVNSVSSWLQGALGMPVGAITDLVSNYQKIVDADVSTEEKLKQAALAVTEHSWDALLGLGRLAHTVVESTAADLMYALPGEDARHARLEAELFGFSHGGDFLHGASFQHSIGASETTSNSRERYRRYAVVCPCEDFDPAMELALRWEWSEVALRAIREGFRHRLSLLDSPRPAVEVRSEARLFWSEQEQIENQTHFEYGAAIFSEPPTGTTTAAPAVQCTEQWSWTWSLTCLPSSHCEKTGSWPSQSCVAAAAPPSSAAPAWNVVWDAKLAKVVGGQPATQVGLSALKALRVHFHCAPKSAFGAQGGPDPAPASFRACVEEGVKSNAARKSELPWRLYHEEEVVVVADFGTLDQARCVSRDQATEAEVCDEGALSTPDLDAHLSDAERMSSTGGVYHGLRTGSGYPEGAVREVVLRPEDVLEVIGQLIPDAAA